jgi:hypothetical protein
VHKKKDAINKLIYKYSNVSYKIFPFPCSERKTLYFTLWYIKIILPKTDLVHAIDFVVYDRKLAIPQILTVHDLSLVRFPSHQGVKQSAQRVNMLKLACRDATKIIAVSTGNKK